MWGPAFYCLLLSKADCQKQDVQIKMCESGMGIVSYVTLSTNYINWSGAQVPLRSLKNNQGGMAKNKEDSILLEGALHRICDVCTGSAPLIFNFPALCFLILVLCFIMYKRVGAWGGKSQCSITWANISSEKRLIKKKLFPGSWSYTTCNLNNTLKCPFQLTELTGRTWNACAQYIYTFTLSLYMYTKRLRYRKHKIESGLVRGT